MISALTNPAYPSSQDEVVWADLPELRKRQNWKWQTYPADLLPAWVADMDIVPPPAIQRALTRMVEIGDYGYPIFEGDHYERAVEQAFAARMQRLYGWAIAPEDVVCVNNIVQSIYYGLMAFTEPGDGVVVQMPSYPPFRKAIATMGRTLVANDLVDDGSGFVIDFDSLSASIKSDTKILILCNPHNPTGRVLTESELRGIAQIAIDKNLIVLADEIHSDLLYDGLRHIPFASLGADIAARTITLSSASKSFGMPAIRCAVMHFGSPELRETFHRRVPKLVLGHPSLMGIEATLAAWAEGDGWLANLVTALTANRDHVFDRLRAEAPGIVFHKPEATYMAYLDCSALKINGSVNDYFMRKGLAFSGGETFHDSHSHRVRLNFATGPAILDTILDRMVIAAKDCGG